MSTRQATLELLSHEEARTTFHDLRQHIKPYKKSQLKTLWVAVRCFNATLSQKPANGRPLENECSKTNPVSG